MSDERSAARNRDGVAVHSIPCRVRVESGVRNAPVKSFFSTSIRNHENDVCASLRGRPLKGLELQLPSGYAGAVVGVTDDSDHSKHLKSHEINLHAGISSLHYWCLGVSPSTGDRLPQALAWTHIADTLHTPLPIDDES